MSNVPGRYGLQLVRGTTWEDEFTYTDAAGVAIDMTGYGARMQVWDLDAEFSATGTALLELLTTGASPALAWNTAASGRLVITEPPAAHAVLNPANEDRVVYGYAVELFNPAGRVIPLVRGRLTVYGWGIH